MKANAPMRSLCAAVMLVAGPLGAGCNNALPPNDTPPDVPPQSTLVIEFEKFTSAGAKLDGAATARIAQPIPGGNFLFAAGNLVVWSVAITVTLAIPVAAFAAAIDQDPQQLANGTWQWAYAFNVNGVQHSAKLQALADGGEIAWTMLISKDGDYTDYRWFTGESNLVGSAGTWTLNYPPGSTPEEPRPFLFIEWHRDASDETGDIKYTNITPDAPENGGYIFYGITGDAPYDAFYTIASAGDDRVIDIEFSTEDKVGRVRDPIHFNDAEWHCWDTELQNAACDE